MKKVLLREGIDRYLYSKDWEFNVEFSNVRVFSDLKRVVLVEWGVGVKKFDWNGFKIDVKRVMEEGKYRKVF